MRKRLFNIFCLAWAILFAYLGFWQVERLHWKEGLIAQVEKYRNESPVELDLKDFDVKRDLFKKVILHGTFLHEDEILLAAKYSNSKRDKETLGYHVITPFQTTEGNIVFVNRGYIPEKYKTQESRPDSLYKLKTPYEIEGLVRENSGKAPWFMPQNMPEKNIWFWIDLPEMMKSLETKTHMKNIMQVLIQQTKLTSWNNFQYPQPIPANIEFYNQHLTYVITWFSLSFVILVMLAIYNCKTKNKNESIS